MASVILLTHST